MGRAETHTHVEPRVGGGASLAWTILDALVLVAAVTAGALLGEYLVRELRARRMHAQVEDELRQASQQPVVEFRVPPKTAPDQPEPASPAAAHAIDDDE